MLVTPKTLLVTTVVTFKTLLVTTQNRVVTNNILEVTTVVTNNAFPGPHMIYECHVFETFIQYKVHLGVRPHKVEHFVLYDIWTT